MCIRDSVHNENTILKLVSTKSAWVFGNWGHFFSGVSKKIAFYPLKSQNFEKNYNFFFKIRQFSMGTYNIRVFQCSWHELQYLTFWLKKCTQFNLRPGIKQKWSIFCWCRSQILRWLLEDMYPQDDISIETRQEFLLWPFH